MLKIKIIKRNLHKIKTTLSEELKKIKSVTIYIKKIYHGNI